MRIYILDDDEVELALWSVRINQHNPSWDYQTFTNFLEFKEAVCLHQPDVCVVDFVMPFYTGTEACHWLSEHSPNTRCYINTSLDGYEYEVLAESCKAKYMSKNTPFDVRLEVIENGC